MVGVGEQQVRHYLYDASGTIASGGAAQLVLPQSMSRSLLKIQNISVAPLWIEWGSARATCTIASGVVSTVSITNGGFNFTLPPIVEFLGGGTAHNNSSFLGGNLPGYPSPKHTAKGHAVLTGGAVSSIVIDDPGAKYVIAPFVMIYNSDLDPYGCAAPSATSGIFLAASGEPLIYNGTCCPTDPVAVYGATTGQAFTCKWMS